MPTLFVTWRTVIRYLHGKPIGYASEILVVQKPPCLEIQRGVRIYVISYKSVPRRKSDQIKHPIISQKRFPTPERNRYSVASRSFSVCDGGAFLKYQRFPLIENFRLKPTVFFETIAAPLVASVGNSHFYLKISHTTPISCAKPVPFPRSRPYRHPS